MRKAGRNIDRGRPSRRLSELEMSVCADPLWRVNLVTRHVAARKFRAKSKIDFLEVARNGRMVVEVRDRAREVGGSSDQEPIDAYCSDCASHRGDSAEALWRHGTRRSLADRRTGGARARGHVVRQRRLMHFGEA